MENRRKLNQTAPEEEEEEDLLADVSDLSCDDDVEDQEDEEGEEGAIMVQTIQDEIIQQFPKVLVSLVHDYTKPIRYLYAVGGSFKKTVERYGEGKNVWEPVASMGTARYGVGVAVYGGKLCAVGGRKKGRFFNTVERCNEEKNAWEPVASVWKFRAYLGVAVC